MTREEALQRIVDNNFASEYGFDLQILIDCMVVAREMVINSQSQSEDCISREATIDGINRYFHDEYYQRTSIQDCRDCLIEDVIKPLPPVTPQPKTDVLDKIRAEIEQEYLAEGHLSDYWDGIDKCLEIIDKYKAERKG